MLEDTSIQNSKAHSLELLHTNLWYVQECLPGIQSDIEECRQKVTRLSTLSIGSLEIGMCFAAHSITSHCCESGIVAAIAASISAITAQMAVQATKCLKECSSERESIIDSFRKSIRRVVADDIVIRAKATDAGLDYREL